MINVFSRPQLKSNQLYRQRQDGMGIEKRVQYSHKKYRTQPLTREEEEEKSCI
jgi:hypothetical protein